MFEHKQLKDFQADGYYHSKQTFNVIQQFNNVKHSVRLKLTLKESYI